MVNKWYLKLYLTATFCLLVTISKDNISCTSRYQTQFISIFSYENKSKKKLYRTFSAHSISHAIPVYQFQL